MITNHFTSRLPSVLFSGSPARSSSKHSRRSKSLDRATLQQETDIFGPYQSCLPEEDKRGRTREISEFHGRKSSSTARIINRFRDLGLDESKIDPELTHKSTSSQKKFWDPKYLSMIPVVNFVTLPVTATHLVTKGVQEDNIKKDHERKLGQNPDNPYAVTERMFFNLREIENYVINTNSKTREQAQTNSISSDTVYKFAFHSGRSNKEPVLIVRTKDPNELSIVGPIADSQCFQAFKRV